MHEILLRKLHQHYTEHEPAFVQSFEDAGAFATFLQDKVMSADPMINAMLAAGTPLYIIEENCMAVLVEQ